ncbi:MAG: VWA domain-containing protein, partial [Thermoanaerobaculia bacterium]
HDAIWAALDRLAKVEGRKAIVAFTDGRDNASVRHTYREVYQRLAASTVVMYAIHLETEQESLGKRSLSNEGSARPPSPAARDILNTPRFGQSAPTAPPQSVSIPSSPRAQLITMAEATGGRFYSPTRYEDIEHAYSEVADDLGSFYRLGYNSSNLNYDGGWRDILVLVPTVNRAEARTRKGYWARP